MILTSSSKLLLFNALLSLSILTATGQGSYDMHLLVGGFNDAGLQVYGFNSITGDFNLKNTYSINGPTAMAITQDRSVLYITNQEESGGMIHAFRFDPKSGEVSFINKTSTEGRTPVYLILDAVEKNAFVANFISGSMSVIPLNSDGAVGAASQTFTYEGSGVVPRRQASPRAHSAVFTPDQKHLLVADLGTDKWMIYNYDPNASEPLSAGSPPFLMTKEGGGARLSAVHPSGKYIYLNHEIAAEVSLYTYENGNLKWIETVAMEEPDSTKNLAMAADLQLSPDGKFLYVSNRGDANHIVIFSIDETTGKLSLIGREPTQGSQPRFFTIDPTGNFLVVANQRGNNVVIFRRDKTSGLLTPLDKQIEMQGAGALLFVPID